MTLVLLHPLPLDGSIWSDELRGLTARSVAPTLYDFGSTLEDWAAGVLDVCGDGPLVVVGNSVGGSCALEIARLAPDRVRLVVVIGTKAGHRRDPALRDEVLSVLESIGMDVAWSRYWQPLFAPDADPAVVERARSLARAQRLDAVANGVRVFHGGSAASSVDSGCDVMVMLPGRRGR